MPIQFKSLLSSSVANNTFLLKDTNDAMPFQLDLTNNASPDIIDTQKFQNDLRTDVNVNQISITDIEAHLDAGIFKLREYISDTAYQTANGTPVGGEIYYNSTTGLVRYYDDVSSEWKDVGPQIVGIQESIGTGNGSLTDFNVTNAPLNDEALNVYKNGLIVDKSEYSYSAPTINFNNAPNAGEKIYVSYLSEGNPASPIVSAGTQYVVYHQLTSSDIIAKQYTLAVTPSVATNVVLDVIDGTSQHYGVDYNVSGSNVGWSGLGLDGILQVDDVLRLQYFA